MKPRCRVELRLTEEQKARWQMAAGTVDLSTWIRGLVDAEVLRHYPAVAALRPKPRERGCVRWMYHRVGVYCPGCDTTIREE